MKPLKHNTVYNLLHTLVPMASWVVLLPMVLGQLGPVQFGIWALVQSVIGQMGILDLGIGPTVIKQVSDASLRNDDTHARRVSGDALVVYTLLGLLAAVSLWTTLPALMQSLFDIPPEVQPLLPSIARLIGIQILFSLPGSVFTSIARGMQRYDVYASQRVGQTLLVSAFLWLSLRFQFGLVGVVASGTVSTALMYVAAALWVWRKAPLFMPQVKGWNLHSLKRLTTDSLWLFVLQVSGMLIFSTSKIVIGAVLSLETVAIYEVALRVFDFLRVIATALTDAIMPAASALNALGQDARIRRLFRVGTVYMWLFVVGVCVPLFVVAPQIMQIWVGAEVGLPASQVLRILLVGFGGYSLTRVPMAVLIGIWQIRVYVMVRAASAVLIPMLVWLGAHFRVAPLIGATVANTGAMLLFDGFLFLYAASLFRTRLRDLLVDNLGPGASSIAASMVALIVGFALPETLNPLLFIGVLLSTWLLLSVSAFMVGYLRKLWPMPEATTLIWALLYHRKRRPTS